MTVNLDNKLKKINTSEKFGRNAWKSWKIFTHEEIEKYCISGDS